MKRNHPRSTPGLEHLEEMHRLVAVINMDEGRFVALQQLDEVMRVVRPRLLVDRVWRRPVFHDVFEPETQDEIPARPGPGEFGEP